MFEKITPEQAGINSKDITNMVKEFNKCGLNTHSLLMMKGDKVFFETYYKPFNKDFNHRYYSQTKSFVSIAIGLLEEEGKLNIHDPILKYFPEYLTPETHEYIRKQTIEDMLTMRTCVIHPVQWFFVEENDRVAYYFNPKYSPVVRPSGMYWEYDSDGSQVLCALVEKLSGMKLLDYLKAKMFNEWGMFKTAYTLSTPTGVTWGDSALLATLRDQAAFGRFVMNYGVYNGKRYLNEEYLQKATSVIADNRDTNYKSYEQQGYGYQIWHLKGNAFAFVGMGDQLTTMYKDKDILIAINSSNQNSKTSRNLIYKSFDELVNNASLTPLPENKTDYEELIRYTSNLEIFSLDKGNVPTTEALINGKIYKCEPNQMGIKWFSLNLSYNNGYFEYENAQGVKKINFGRGENVFEKFPQEGYSNMVGKEVSKGYFYDSANSGKWVDDIKFRIEVEIIDKYFGNLNILISFKENLAFIRMFKNAENFLREYSGDLVARRM